MGIRFYCPECSRRMNVKTFLAGKRGICPHCDARWEIPLESEIPEGAPRIRPNTEPTGTKPTGLTAQTVAASPASMAAAKSNAPANGDPLPSFEAIAPTVGDPIDASPNAVWYVRPASGGEFGPAKGDVMRRWMQEGRVGADSMVWCEGWAEWQIAGPIFPSLAPSPEQPTDPVDTPAQMGAEPKTIAALESIQKKTDKSNGRVAHQRSSATGKSIAAIVILGLMIVALFVVLIFAIQK
ncbi:MAG: DUF4339 domain-containing protein [Pirellulaceae bacterium]|nr:DUF4339 domain-containing protein [Pirellulaceae bacterium]